MFITKLMELRGTTSCIFWLCFIQIFQFYHVLSVQRGNETDRFALLAFKAQLNDPFNRLSSWNDSTHFCKWYGVTCGRRHQRVIVLELDSCKLVGSLTPQIGNLSFLKVLYLDNNGFNGTIPPELGHLHRLKDLDLENNTFTGQIPVNLSRCSNLMYLDLGGNKLSGKLPTEFGSLTKLRALWFYNNKLEGELPLSFGNLSSLEDFAVAENNLHGHIPDSFGKLKKLTSLAIGDNHLTGIIPPSIYNISSITLFAVAINQLQGSLPNNLGNLLPNLEIFEIYSNQFSGQIPTTISNASKLAELEVSVNRFSGNVPKDLFADLTDLWLVNLCRNNLGSGKNDDLNFLSYLTNNSNLEVIDVYSNKFGGVLPEYVGNFSVKLIWFRFGFNRLHGNIPDTVGNFLNLGKLNLEGNRFTGTIPSSIGKLQNLAGLFLSSNELSGSIPSSLGNLSFLEDLELDKNNLYGRIPSSLGNCRNLLYMSLSQNNLSGSIPKEVMSISSLSISLILSDNQLTGSIPMEVDNLVHLGILDISNNMLSGKIPGSLGSCGSMEYLFLQGNNFQGIIPPSLSSLRALQSLDLSRNNLSGQIPEFLGRLKLMQNLNLSFNYFEGEVPKQGVFTNASRASLAGNGKLCGGISELRLPTCPMKDSKKGKNPSLKLIIPVVFGSFVLIAGLCLTCFYLFRRTKTIPSSAPDIVGSLLQVSYENLLKATGGFSSENLLGAGYFGSVYKGILVPDGMIVAVKVLNLQHRGASKSFMAECETLRNVRHRNLVKIITACSSIDFAGNDFKALVYEFMVNGSMEDWLHRIQRANEAPRIFSFSQRLNVAIDIASALDYLHNNCETTIVHCDLKPSNVLFDEEMTGRVGDFGLAKFLPTTMHSDQSSSIGVRGTVGYTPP